MPKLSPRRPRGCAFCWPLPGETRPAGPEAGCSACWARDWAPLPYPKLERAEWDTIVGLVDFRCGGRCERCSLPFLPGVREMSLHHRRPQRMGGTDDPAINGLANLLGLCGGKLAGVTGCHGVVESYRQAAGAGHQEAEGRGWLVAHGSYLPGPDVEPPEINTVVHVGVRQLADGEVIYRRVLLDPTNPAYLDAPGGHPGDRWAA